MKSKWKFFVLSAAAWTSLVSFNANASMVVLENPAVWSSNEATVENVLNIIQQSFVQSLQRAAEFEIQDKPQSAGLNWKVGDSADYNINMGFLPGKMHMVVKSEENNAYWVNQDVDLGFLGQQKIEILIDKNDGSVKKMVVNGKEEQPPAAGEQEIKKAEESRVKVPLGEFDCIYLQIVNKGENASETEAWINPKEVPINGMLKTVQPGQMGKVTLELTARNFVMPR